MNMTYKTSIIGKPKPNLALLILATSVFALSVQIAQAKPPRGHKPPQEAIDVCVDKSEGDNVSFETRRGDMKEATCQYIEEQLVAVPNDHKSRDKPQRDEY